MAETLSCLRCGTEMQFIKREYLQLGRTGWVLGDLGNLIAGALEVDILTCPRCGKLEFFSGRDLEPEGSGIAQVTCLRCGKSYDMDDPKCPFCGEKNLSW